VRAGRVLLAVTFLLGACASDGAPDASPRDRTGRQDVAVEWYLRSISEEDRRIDIVYTISGVASGCERKGTASADESEAAVAVRAVKSVTTDRDRACTEELGYVEESVTLDEPLGDRALVGCRPGRVQPTENAICRDLDRSRNAGIFEFPTSSPRPS
jgi:hypothetical protein